MRKKTMNMFGSLGKLQHRKDSLSINYDTCISRIQQAYMINGLKELVNQLAQQVVKLKRYICYVKSLIVSVITWNLHHNEGFMKSLFIYSDYMKSLKKQALNFILLLVSYLYETCSWKAMPSSKPKLSWTCKWRHQRHACCVDGWWRGSRLDNWNQICSVPKQLCLLFRDHVFIVFSHVWQWS